MDTDVLLLYELDQGRLRLLFVTDDDSCTVPSLLR